LVDPTEFADADGVHGPDETNAATPACNGPGSPAVLAGGLTIAKFEPGMYEVVETFAPK
jgi:hypothetical protein